MHGTPLFFPFLVIPMHVREHVAINMTNPSHLPLLLQLHAPPNFRFGICQVTSDEQGTRLR